MVHACVERVHIRVMRSSCFDCLGRLQNLRATSRASSVSRATSACSESRCALTETNSPTAIDIDPATRPATPATRIVCFDASAAPTPIIRLDTETIASFDPSTAARSQPVRPLL